ncbi:biotin-dependent carboxylase uncharacterized domain-containing protein [Gemmobacter megaterium]|uniref:Biotin-dependent carboxylase uncharacterized domain-containing protein n=1 Tax=Gemmobacter megaterium TaxID=1086013 RepID=A0A1N7PSY0_9RHOB|nr:biotin-dependent carboxyltransferase family protein [Gemmobacter megaterium]GGE21128.1 allophanate hydrolase [Gemmobacter megaterium]SIT13655.1 biotin-dependent carboxylase uncharacterized domain-containing protein [Gemmobacter megaterium]
MSRLVVERCAPGVSVQDGGRTGWRRYGVSTAGAMDRLALAVANVLVGNGPDCAAVEVTLAGARFRVAEGPVLVAVGGPGAVLSVDGLKIPQGASARADTGQMVEISAILGGVYGYLAVAGGIALPPEMGSRSAHLRSGIGGGLLTPGDNLPVGRGALTPRAMDQIPAHTSGAIRCIPGPQEDWFAADALDLLVAADWQIDMRSDRMGRFLVGPRLAPDERSMVSDGVLPGSIQVPPAGQPIILMRDCQTTGGYPKLATVISADLDRLAQLPAGANFRLALVERADAVAAAQRLAHTIAGLVAHPSGRIDSRRLLSANLIDGMVDATADPFSV